MFRVDQFLSATTLIRCFKEVAQRLALGREPLLITKRDGRFLVVMNGELFEGLMDARDRAVRIQADSEDSFPDDLKT